MHALTAVRFSSAECKQMAQKRRNCPCLSHRMPDPARLLILCECITVWLLFSDLLAFCRSKMKDRDSLHSVGIKSLLSDFGPKSARIFGQATVRWPIIPAAGGRKIRENTVFWPRGARIFSPITVRWPIIPAAGPIRLSILARKVRVYLYRPR